MDPLPKVNYVHVQAQTNAIIIVIYLMVWIHTESVHVHITPYFGMTIVADDSHLIW